MYQIVVDGKSMVAFPKLKNRHLQIVYLSGVEVKTYPSGRNLTANEIHDLIELQKRKGGVKYA